MSAEDLYERMRASGPRPEMRGSNEYHRRWEFIEQFAWAIPDKATIERIVAFARGDLILEVMAGRGLWAKLLKDAGANIIATDSLLPHDAHHHGYPKAPLFIDVEPLDARAAVKRYRAANVLLLCWPPMDDGAEKALRSFKGTRLVYIGEGPGGCTATKAFHERLDRWGDTESWDIPQWAGIHDYVSFHEKSG